MGLHCEISLNKAADSVYTPGSIVSGKIRYSLNEDTVFSNIIVSLKGQGSLILDDEFEKSNDRLHTYWNKETYVDIDTVIHNNEKKEPIPVGSYETDFSYQLPHNIPGSLKYLKISPEYTARCNIKYYIRIKFERPGLLNFNKTYKKKITVISGVTPRLPTEPTVYGEQKSLMQLSSLFSSKKSIVSIKATMANSVTKPGESVKVDYEVQNNSNVTLKGVEIKLVQVDTYFPKNHKEARIVEEVKDTDIKYGAVQSNECRTFSDELNIPMDLASFDHSKIYARDYAVVITAIIPMPHRNLVLEIPFQVIERLDGTFEDQSGSVDPPSYWEAMEKFKKEISGKSAEDSSDDE